MKYYSILLIFLGISIYILIANRKDLSNTLPYFRIADPLIGTEIPQYPIKNKSFIHVSNDRIALLKRDYLNIWSHLDHLHNTNDQISGKRFYTEDFFNSLVRIHSLGKNRLLKRKNLSHNVIIYNISPDGLICTIIDSSIMLEYVTPSYYYFDTINVAMVLLYQGENWRIDAVQQF